MPSLLFTPSAPLRPPLPSSAPRSRPPLCALHANGSPSPGLPPSSSRATLRALRAQLAAAVSDQRFSDAAALRDAIAAAERAALQSHDDAVLVANDAFYHAFRTADLDLMRHVWLHADTVSCAHPLAGLVTGYEDVMNSWATLFAMGRPVELNVQEISLNVMPNLAWVVAQQDVQSMRGSRTIGGTRIATNVFQKRRGTWKLVHHHASPVANDDAPPPQTGQGGA